MSAYPILLDGQWREARASGTFQAENPRTRQTLPEVYPVSGWSDLADMLEAAQKAFAAMRALPPERIAAFLEAYAERLEARSEAIVAAAHAETGLPRAPRLAEVELPRTLNQLRLGAAAAREQSWSMPTIDTKARIRSYYAAVGPVVLFGPNNFPLAYNAVTGGDFVAALAAGNPVIAKAHPLHPTTTRLAAEEALRALRATGLPPAALQMFYHCAQEDGLRLVAHGAVGAAAFTGSRAAGLKLKAAADAAGKPIYLEMSSINPVVVLPGALEERADEIAEQYVASLLLNGGQFCTNPGLMLLLPGERTEQFITAAVERVQAAPVDTLLSRGVAAALTENLKMLIAAGATVLTGGKNGGGDGYCHQNTLLRLDDLALLNRPELQAEVFGNVGAIVVARTPAVLRSLLTSLEGNLTGSIYSARDGRDDELYAMAAPILRQKVGRLLNDKMPTGVAVSPAMNHGGPFPATGHPGFTSVGIPASLRRFAMLQCFDHVRHDRLPAVLQDRNPTGRTWRLIDGEWTTADVPQ